MKFALVNKVKTIAVKGQKGVCPNCRSEVIAKCGEFKQAHWAHKTMRNCDAWWESETEWHRNWKNHFPTEWQEIIKYDNQSGEKHIADICTNKGLVVEFQHSPIASEERIKREAFYKPMVWIIDGARLKRDFARFERAMSSFHRTNMRGVYHVSFPDKCFPNNWLQSSVPVLFDFKGNQPIDRNDIRNHLYLIMPQIKQNEITLGILTRESCIQDILKGGNWFSLKR